MKKKKLTPNQRLFIAEYLKDRNGTRSYLKAYPKVKKETTAATNAGRLLRNAEIAKAIEESIQKQEKRLEISADRTLAEIAKVAFHNAKSLYDESGNLKKITDMDDDTTACIAGVDVNVSPLGDETKKIKICDKNSALEKLAKHFGLYDEDNRQKSDITLRVVYDSGPKKGKD